MNKAYKRIKKAITGFKGFLFGGRCALNTKYAENTTYKKVEDEDMRVCTDKGFHFCKEPEDVWHYYPPMNQGLPSCYARVTIPEGAVVAEGLYLHPKAISNEMHIWYFTSVFNFALSYFRRLEAKMVDKVSAVSVVAKKKGLCSPDTGAIIIGSRSQQAIATLNGTIGITTKPKSAVKSPYLAITADETSFSASEQMAIALRGGAASSKIAVGGSYAYAREPGGVALVLRDDGIASGRIDSVLVFYASGSPMAFKVDGKKVKADTLYTLCRGCLCEVKPFADIPEGALE